MLLKFWECIKYLACVSMIGFVIGRLLPKYMMHWDKIPYKAWDFEGNGKFYNRLKINVWQSKLPDMSKLFKKIMPQKCLPDTPTKENITVMLQETCIAELIHILLCFAGIGCMIVWQGAGGCTVALLYALGNIPFIMVQRYTRPKLKKILERIQKKVYEPNHKIKECAPCEC